MIQPYNSIAPYETGPTIVELSYDDMIGIAVQAAAFSDHRDRFTARLRIDTLRELGKKNNPLETLDKEYGFAGDVTFEMLVTDAFKYVRSELNRQILPVLQDNCPEKMGGGATA